MPDSDAAMTTNVIPGLDAAPTRHKRLLAWVREIAALVRERQLADAE